MGPTGLPLSLVPTSKISMTDHASIQLPNELYNYTDCIILCQETATAHHLKWQFLVGKQVEIPDSSQAVG